MQSVDGGVKIVCNIYKSESLDNFYDISHKFQYLSSVFCSSSEAMIDFEGIFFAALCCPNTHSNESISILDSVPLKFLS